MKEIDILLKAADKCCAVVEKQTHLRWTPEELHEVGEAGCYAAPDSLAPPSDDCAVTSPYPGCMHSSAAPEDVSRYRLVGQTEHFLIFAPP